MGMNQFEFTGDPKRYEFEPDLDNYPEYEYDDIYEPQYQERLAQMAGLERDRVARLAREAIEKLTRGDKKDDNEN